MKTVLVLMLLGWGAAAERHSGSVHDYSTNIISTELSNPFAVVTAPNGNLYVTEKAGEVKVFSPSGQLIEKLRGIPSALYSRGQGGLMDMAFDPAFDRNGFVYLSYSTRRNARPSNGVNTRVSRFKLVGDRLTEERVLVQGGFGTDSAHFGSRLAFGTDGKLFVSIGERHNKEKAQDLSFLNGKILRIHSDGRIPQDNPFVGVQGARGEIYSLGHRNPQGMDIHPTGAPVISEHGPTGYDARIPGHGSVGKADEVNWIKPGGNYGWPVVFGDPSHLPWTNAMNDFVQRNNVIMPVREYSVPDGIAPSGAAFYTGDQFPNWKGDFFVAALRGYIMRLKISDSGTLLEEEKVVPAGHRRVRDITTGKDGNLYFLSRSGLVRISR